MAYGQNVVSQFVKARTAEMLVRKMSSLQAKLGMNLKFHDKQYADGFWYAWYEREYSPRMNKEQQEKKEG